LRGVSSHNNLNKEGKKPGFGTTKDKNYQGGTVAGVAAIRES
jgi:hypothetical protein